MNFRPPLTPRTSAFTLVELLTVIAIIAILMGLLFPALTIVKDQANKTKARTDLVNTVAAVKQYYTEYGKYPLTGYTAGASATTATDVVFGATTPGTTVGTGIGGVTAAKASTNALLYEVLRNYPNDPNGNHIGNPRQIVFFEGKNAIGTATNAKSGFGYKNGTSQVGANLGALYDPWGTEYFILIDGDYDNNLTLPHKDFSSQPFQSGCVGWSLGKDGGLGKAKSGQSDDSFRTQATGTNSDDVITWQ